MYRNADFCSVICWSKDAANNHNAYIPFSVLSRAVFLSMFGVGLITMNGGYLLLCFYGMDVCFMLYTGGFLLCSYGFQHIILGLDCISNTTQP